MCTRGGCQRVHEFHCAAEEGKAVTHDRLGSALVPSPVKAAASRRLGRASSRSTRRWPSPWSIDCPSPTPRPHGSTRTSPRAWVERGPTFGRMVAILPGFSCMTEGCSGERDLGRACRLLPSPLPRETWGVWIPDLRQTGPNRPESSNIGIGTTLPSGLSPFPVVIRWLHPVGLCFHLLMEHGPLCRSHTENLPIFFHADLPTFRAVEWFFRFLQIKFLIREHCNSGSTVSRTPYAGDWLILATRIPP